MAFDAEHYAGEIHIYAASMREPEKFNPEFHVYYQSKLPWLKLEDTMPKYEGTLYQASQSFCDNE